MAIHTLSIDKAADIKLESKDVQLTFGIYRRFDLRIEDEDGAIFLLSFSTPTAATADELPEIQYPEEVAKALAISRLEDARLACQQRDIEEVTNDGR